MTLAQNLFIQAGATFAQTFPLLDGNNNPLNVSGMTANAAMKQDIFSNNTVTVFEVTLANGSVSLRLEANTTANMAAGKYNYDVVLVNGANTTRVAEGYIDVDPGVTGISLYANGAN